MIVWIASYPKSGNTWVRSIISSLIYTENGHFKFEDLKNIPQFPQKKYFDSFTNEFGNIHEIKKYWVLAQDKINLDKKIKFFKTHHIFCKYGDNAFTNSSNTLGVIHIVRDPRNLISSIKHHWSLETLEDAKNKIFDEQTMTGINIEINKEYSFPVMISSWNNHYNAWKKISKNYLLIKYEDLIDDFEKELNRIIIYINNIKKLDIDKIKINNILKTTTFDNFKKMENKGLFNESNFDPKTNQFKTFFNTRPNKNTSQLISKNIKNEIEKKFYNEMKELNYL